MKRTLLNAFGVLTLALPLSLPAANFLDNCTTFNPSLWTKADWDLGRGLVQSGNVNPSGGGVLNFKIPPYTYNGGEIDSIAKYAYGQATAQFKCPNVQGVISSIFFYQGTGTASDEIDIEIYKNYAGTWEIDFTVYKAGVITYQTSYYPSFDPSAGYNTYMIDWAGSALGFYVNGGLQARLTTAGKIPTHAMNIQLNAWWPDWIPATQATSNKYMQVNWISYTAH